ncbi:MAG: NAD(P)H-hydrate epimerase [Chloroflexi bacterium]|nr:NAD(P)H-hydrate epimerase [Chloroflexota bacterium]
MNLISVESMKRLESEANLGGYTFETMMRRAGQNLALEVNERFALLQQKNILGLIGSGNNGGDTLIALTELLDEGWSSCGILMNSGNQPQTLIEEFERKGGSINIYGPSEIKSIEEAITRARVILDGLIGTGFKPPMKSPHHELLSLIGKKRHEKTIIAVDCPSGMDCSSGEVSAETLRADITVCMEAVKEGLLKFPAFDYCGEIAVVDLGIPAKFKGASKETDFVIDADFVKKHLPFRKNQSHKGSFGHLMVCGGCVNYIGAPVLAAKSAFRIGAGMVELAIPERIFEATAGSLIESIYLLLEDEDGVIAESAFSTLLPRLMQSDCLLIGPGLGREEATHKFFNRVFFEPYVRSQGIRAGFVPSGPEETSRKPLEYPLFVIDADALTLLSKTPDWYTRIKTQAVLTPHPGEMARLTGMTVDEIQNDRMETARKFAILWGQVVVLKGALTVVASPAGQIAVLPFANAVLSKAGTGDVLSGMIAGLIAQKIPIFEAASSAVWLHARAGFHAARKLESEISLLASDIIDQIPVSLREITQNTPQNKF